jgi:ubiquinone/menaquinone biosynthesis C-methylase UbiE
MRSDSSNRENDRHPQYAHSGNVAEQLLLEKRSAEVEAAFLLRHLQSDIDILDCGCGPGTITIGLAQVVSTGRVTGMDMEDAQIARARELAAERKLTNIHFRAGNIYELPFPDASFDIVFAHAVFEHLSEPLKALSEIYRVLKVGGMIALRDADFDFLATGGPHEKILKDSCTIMAEQWKHVSGNPYIGKNLRALLNQAGYMNCEGTATAEYFGTSETTRSFGEFMSLYFENSDVAARIVALELATTEELDQIKAAWREWGKSPDAFAAVLWCEALGWKK